MSIRADIENKLVAALAPLGLEVIDESRLHAGHAGLRQGAAAQAGSESAASGETHFRVTITSRAFIGLSLVERQRMVYRLLKEELQGPVHALALRTLAPGE